MAVYIKYLRIQNLFLNSNRMSWGKCKSKLVTIQAIHQLDIHTTPFYFKRRKSADERKSNRIIEYSPKAKGDFVDIWRGITLSELARVFDKDINYIYDIFLNQYRNPNMPITDIKVLQQAIHRGGKRMRIIGKPSDSIEEVVQKDVFPRPPPLKSELKPRPPVVTVMGHIDHGKTTLLDALRNSRVVDQEFGGITQHIGAFSVTLGSGAQITFLDTPGHAAFSAMRSRGANLTDIVVLVVAADDGVMEQTVESIKMARHAKVPILVAINKIDSPKADLARTEKMLVEVGIQVEKLGGDVQAIPISALKKQNIEQLTEALILQAELLEMGADPTGPVEAVVVESKAHPFRGKLCTVVIQRGTLKKGDILVAGTSMARVKALKNDAGKLLETVSPGFPVEIDGWKDLPSAGEQVLQVETERRAREVLKFRQEEKSEIKLKSDAQVIADKEQQHDLVYKEKLALKRQLGRYKSRSEGPRKPEISKDDGPPSLNIIIKADVDGTLEAILDTIDTYDSDDCKMDLVHYGVGAITENDIELAETFQGLIYAFNVDVPANLKEFIKTAQIKHFNVIYKLIDNIKEEINARLPAKEVEEILGEAVVMKLFEITQGKKKIPVAGCRCTKGLLKKNAQYRIVRNGIVVNKGSLSSMRHLKNEVDVIKLDTECGLQFAEKSLTFEEGDVLVCYELKMVPQKTDWDPGF